MSVLTLCASSTGAQTLTPAQSAADQYLRQQERTRLLRSGQESAPEVRDPLPATSGPQRLPNDEKPCVNIHQITLVGDAAEQFQWALAAAQQTGDGTMDSAIGRCLGTRGINVLMQRIQAAIVAHGYVAAQVVWAGSQEKLDAGLAQFTLFPGRIRSIRFVPEPNHRATQWNAVPAKPGDLIELQDIEQALENFKRIPSVEADIQIALAQGPGIAPGQSDVLIQWQQKFPLRFNLSADDAGTQATGKYQGSMTVSYDHWWTLNDLFYLSLNHDLGGGTAGEKGTHGYTVHYSLPFAYWLLGLTSSSNRYRQSVAGASQTYIYNGESQNNEIKLSRVLYRDALRKTTFSVAGWSRTSKNFIDDTEVEVQRRRMAGWELGLSHREFIASATLDLNLKYRRGTGAFHSLPAPEEAFGEGTARPKISTLEAQLNAPFSLSAQSMRYNGTLRAQFNGTPLVPQDRFAIGGRYTVRGFDGESQLSAERGWLIRNDLSFLLGQTDQELYVAWDRGQVSGPTSQNLVGTQLTGAVLGLRGGVKGWFYDVFVGRALSQPSGFNAAKHVAGFNLSLSF